MNKNLAILLSIALSLPAISQASHVTGYGAYTSTSTANKCTSLTCETGYDSITGITGDFQYDSDGAQYRSTASSSETTYANAQASSALSGASYLPTLRVQTTANTGSGAWASAFGVQAYTYTGLDSSIFTLDYNLHGSVGSNLTGAIGSSYLRGDIAILVGSEAHLDWYPDISTLYYEVGYGFDQAGMDSLFINNGVDVNTSGSLSFGLNPGDIFYVIAALGAKSLDGYADSWNTFSMNFLDDTDLVAATAPAVSAVPVPAAAWLFGSALLGFIGVNRRKKTAV
ncbi:MAG: VPLPA-CTERM sorting domain-containing protein [Gammaproteobacteria bacterium]|nr:VPLPA-CTERM sorting domain-containing protein [Gammaproteobacteria bacterium]